MKENKILDIQKYYDLNFKKINDYLTMLCNHFKTKIEYNSFCFKILDYKFKTKPLKKIYSKSISKHVFIIVVASWSLVEKFIEDDTILICNYIKKLKEKIINAEYEIFLDIPNLCNIIKRPRSESF